MATKDEAIHKALKVLNCLNNDRVYETAWVKGAINACEEALEQPAQEPVGYVTNSGLSAVFNLGVNLDDDTPLYTHPAPSWQGLSDNEIAMVIKKTFPVNIAVTNVDLKFARAIEQAHGIGS